MQTVNEWLGREDVRRVREAKLDELMAEKFFRDPMRPLYYDRAAFYSPADGFILYSLEVGPKQRIIQVKGRNLTTQELLQDFDYSARSLVVGVFLTFYDVHVNRMPTDGFVHFRRPEASGDEPMASVEASIFKRQKFNPNDLAYAFRNERVVTRIYCPILLQSYYLVQIADREVDTITIFATEGEYFTQGDRLGAIRFGSQVDLIIPLTNPRFQFRSLVKDKVLYHVEAGVDKLVQVTAKDE
jgi:phosphatidylserine decarboxylase